MTQGELLAIAPDIRKLFVNACKINWIPVYSAAAVPPSHEEVVTLAAQTPPLYTAPIMEIDVRVGRKHPEVGLYDTGAELVCISAVTVKELHLLFNPDLKLTTRDANGGLKMMFGVVENLEIAEQADTEDAENARPKRQFPQDPLLSLPELLKQPKPVEDFGVQLMKERWEALGIQQKGFLLEEEVKLAFELLMKNELALAWDDSEKGRFSKEYFDPIVVLTIEHKPWALKNIPIPHGLREVVIQFIKDKIATGTYKPSGSSY
ncbi:hypothetical protein K439DRAFT_1523989 [Ramaria rubella]|nr:hypothetical protein K439DRAFT_1523989 [Ramaria rubella]